MYRVPMRHTLIQPLLMIGAATLFTSCDDPPQRPQTSTPRVISVKPSQQLEKEFCEGGYTPDSNITVAWPAGIFSPPKNNKPLWVNLWATWCGPCIREMPLLKSWSHKHGFTPYFLSVDADEQTLRAWENAHPEMGRSNQLSEWKTWLNSIAVDADTVPIHILLDPQHKVRCIRRASIDVGHEAHVQKLMAQLK